MRIVSICSCVLIALLVFTSVSLAHDEDAEKDPSIWDKNLSFGFNLNKGNSDTTLFHFGGQASRDYQKNVWLFDAKANFGETVQVDEDTDDEVTEKTKQDVQLLADYKRILGERWFSGVATSFLYDEIADVDYRVQPSLTLGYFLLKEEKLKLNVGIGPSYVFEKLDGVKNDYFAPKATERFDWEFSDTGSVYQSIDFTYDVDDTDNTLTIGEVGIQAALNSSMSLVFTVRNQYDNVPAPGAERNDLAMVTSLKVAL